MTVEYSSSKDYDQPRDYADGKGGLDKPDESKPSGAFRAIIGPSVGLGVICILLATGYKVEGSEALATDVALLGLALIGWPVVLGAIAAIVQTIHGWIGGGDD